jgi:hypothetical protein
LEETFASFRDDARAAKKQKRENIKIFSAYFLLVGTLQTIEDFPLVSFPELCFLVVHTRAEAEK